MSSDEFEWMSVGEAASLIGMHRNNVLKAISGGRLPARKVGGRFLVDRKDAAKYRKVGHRPKKKEEE